MKTKIIMIGAVLATGAAMADPTPTQIVTSKAYVDDQVATKQPNLAGSGANVAVTFPSEPGGTPNSRDIGTTVTTGDALVTTGGVNTALNAKQKKIGSGGAGGSGANGDVVTYTGTAGTVSSKGVYNSGAAYSGQTGKLVEAQHVNAAVTNGFNNHMTCYQNQPGTNKCWLYTMNDMSGGTYVPQPAQ